MISIVVLLTTRGSVIGSRLSDSSAGGVRRTQLLLEDKSDAINYVGLPALTSALFNAEIATFERCTRLVLILSAQSGRFSKRALCAQASGGRRTLAGLTGRVRLFSLSMFAFS